MRRARPLIVAAAFALLAACGSASGTVGSEATSPGSPVRVSPSGSPTEPPSPDALASPSVATTPAPSLPRRFAATVQPLPAELAARMRGTTWHAGCPVPISALRLLTFRYWGFDGQVHEGPMVANASVADGLVSVFRTLFRARFPLKHVALASRFRPNADPNTRRSITASFNCRPIVTPAGAGSVWSQHAYGLAVDINPLQNPYVAVDGFVRNRFARRYRNRSQHLTGMIHPGDVVVRAFASIGWGWGGDWSSGKDYMHFSLSGT